MRVGTLSVRPLAGCLTVAILLQGCGLFKRPPFSSTAAYAKGQLTPGDILDEQQKEYVAVIDYCEKLVSGFDRSREGIGWTLITLGVFCAALGAAGSVVLAASAANKTLAAAFSSGAGVAAGVQPLFAKQGLSPEQVLVTRNAIADSVRTDMTEWGAIPITNDKTEIEKRKLVIEKLKGHCRFFSIQSRGSP